MKSDGPPKPPTHVSREGSKEEEVVMDKGPAAGPNLAFRLGSKRSYKRCCTPAMAVSQAREDALTAGPRRQVTPSGEEPVPSHSTEQRLRFEWWEVFPGLQSQEAERQCGGS